MAGEMYLERTLQALAKQEIRRLAISLEIRSLRISPTLTRARNSAVRESPANLSWRFLYMPGP